jgi:hypothetical protein
MGKLELKVKQNPGLIELNFDEIEKYLDEKLAEYEGILFIEETKDIAKKELATLRSLKKDFDDSRKAIKKGWMKPYEAFETRVKNLLAKIDKPITLIDEQVKEFEEKRKAEKRVEIKKIYAEHIGEMESYLPLEKIYDAKWENTTYSIKKVKEDIEGLVSGCVMDVETIKGMESEAEESALRAYRQSLLIADAISVINAYEKQKSEILKREAVRKAQEEERKRIEEIEKIRAEERANLPPPPTTGAEPEKTEPEDEAITAFTEDISEDLPFAPANTVTAMYKMIATPKELEAIEITLCRMGIIYERKDV